MQDIGEAVIFASSQSRFTYCTSVDIIVGGDQWSSTHHPHYSLYFTLCDIWAFPRQM
jgi:hypothetical protein